MQKISELIPGASQPDRTQPTSQTTCAKSLPEKWVAALFAKLQARYGLAWSQQWTTTEMRELAVKEWGKRLGGLTGEQIKRGLNSWASDWPPNVESFRKACLGTDEHWQHRTAAYRVAPRALPKPRPSPEAIAEHMRKLREALQ